MKIVNFPESNKTYTKPEGMDDCQDLPVFECEDGRKISCWEFTPHERLLAIFQNKIWLHVWFSVLPPVCVTPEYPFKDADKKPMPIEQMVEAMIERKVKQFLNQNKEKLALIDNTSGITLNREKLLTEYTNFIFEIKPE